LDRRRFDQRLKEVMEMEKFRYIPGVTSLTLDTEACNGCRTCTLVCPHGVLTMNNHKADIIDLDGCMECGACAMNCPENALSVNPGVGCAAYIIQTWIKGKDKAACGNGVCC
jgi:ferredoxin